MRLLQEEDNRIEDIFHDMKINCAFDLIETTVSSRQVESETLKTYCNGTISYLKKFIKKIEEMEKAERKKQDKEAFEELMGEDF